MHRHEEFRNEVLFSIEHHDATINSTLLNKYCRMSFAQRFITFLKAVENHIFGATKMETVLEQCGEDFLSEYPVYV